MAFPVPPLTFVRCADVSPAAANIAGFLDAIYSALSAVNDYRGTAKPATHAWTFTQRQVLSVTNAITCEPPAALGLISPVVIIGGLGSIEGAAIGALIVGMARALAVHLAPVAELFAIYIVMAIVLMFRPEGLFQRIQARKI